MPEWPFLIFKNRSINSKRTSTHNKTHLGRKLWTPDLRDQEIVGAEQIDLSKEILVVHSNGKVEGRGLFFYEFSLSEIRFIAITSRL